jgi:DNA-binding CsgD family transcriptional regulator
MTPQRSTNTNLLIDALDGLAACRTDNERWACGTDMLGRCGSTWLTAGTAPRARPTSVAIRSTTPESLMRDYIDAGIHRQDTWMQYCATSLAIDACEVRPTTRSRLSQASSSMARLFDDYGVHRAILLPSYGGARPGGFVLYACSAATADWLAHPEGLAHARLLTAILSAHYRPDEDQSGDPQTCLVQSPLTARESEVLQWLSQGLRTARIAERMGIEPVTVSKHLAACCRKLDARTREQALAIAVRDRLIAI